MTGAPRSYPVSESADLKDYFNPPRVKIAAYLLASYEDDTVAPVAKSLVDWGTNLVKVGMSAEHSGDCTKESHACSRCIADKALAHADVILGLAQKVPDTLSVREAAVEVWAAVERTDDHTQWFAALAQLKSALDGNPAQCSPSRDDIAKTMWLAEYRRATGKERSITWYDVANTDRDKYLFVADAILAISSRPSPELEDLRKTNQILHVLLTNQEWLLTDAQKIIAEYKASTGARADVAARGMPGTRGQAVPAAYRDTVRRVGAVREKRLRETLDALRALVDAVNRHGNWDDGCFYYGATSASELQHPLKMAETALALPSTQQQCEHGNHLETCTICLMWRSLPSTGRDTP